MNNMEYVSGDIILINNENFVDYWAFSLSINKEYTILDTFFDVYGCTYYTVDNDNGYKTSLYTDQIKPSLKSNRNKIIDDILN